MEEEIADFDFLEQFIIDGKWDFYPIAYDYRRKFVVGYEIKTKKARYCYESPLTCEASFDFDMLADCCDEYAEWAVKILADTKYKRSVYEDERNYYETLIKE